MEVKEGYIQTDVGIFPVDWDVYQLSENVKVQRGGSPRPIEHYISKNDKGYNWIKIGDTSKGGKYILTTKEKIISDGLSKTRQVKNGDLLLSNSMSFGRPYILKIDGCIHDGWLVLYDFLKAYDKEYLYYILSSEFVFKQYLSLAAGSGVLNLNKDIVLSINLPLPPLPEQKAIAEVLSDTDNLIQSLEKQIAKKRLIKKGAMQKLLSPKEGWKEKKISDLIYSFQNGYAFSSKGYVKEGIPIVTMTQIGLDGSFQFDENSINHWMKNEINKLRNFHLHNGDVIIAMTDVTPDKNLIGRMTIVETNKTLLLNQRVGHLRIDKSKVNTIILTSLSNMNQWRQYCIASASLGVQANLSTKDILNGTILLPTISEQNRFAAVFMDFENEITMLKKELNKYKTLKKGLMQNLLTGKIRLNLT